MKPTRRIIAALAVTATITAAPAVAAPQPDPSTDPLVNPRAGQWECLSPSAARKICASLVRYQFGPGGVEADRTDAIAGLTVETRFNVVVKAGAVCRRVGPSARGPLVIQRDGHPATAHDVEVMTQAWNTFVAPKDEEVCIFYRHTFGGWAVGARHDGQEARGYSQPVIWVDPSEGWAAGG